MPGHHMAAGHGGVPDGAGTHKAGASIRRGQLHLGDEALRAIITDYTKESGVRTLERQLGKLCRPVAMRLVQTGVKRVDITAKDLKNLLDTPPYAEDRNAKSDQIGVVNGLAWTEVGGELLEVEAGVMDGTGKLELTGNLGQVMQESVKAAYTCLRSRAKELGIAPDFYKTKDIHVHFPEGAVPKDGPSAGIAIATAMLSALTGRAVRRRHDRRGHAAGQGAAHRRTAGKDHGGEAQQHQDRHHSQGKPEGSGGHRPRRPGGSALHPGGDGGCGVRPRADATEEGGGGEMLHRHSRYGETGGAPWRSTLTRRNLSSRL